MPGRQLRKRAVIVINLLELQRAIGRIPEKLFSDDAIVVIGAFRGLAIFEVPSHRWSLPQVIAIVLFARLVAVIQVIFDQRAITFAVAILDFSPLLAVFIELYIRAVQHLLAGGIDVIALCLKKCSFVNEVPFLRSDLL